MIFWDYIKSAIDGLKVKKTRSFLTFLTIFIGVCSIVLISTIGQSGEETINGELEMLGLNGVTIKQKLVSGGINLTLKDSENIEKFLGQDYTVSSVIRNFGSIESNNSQWNTLICGTDKSIKDIMNFKIKYGRNLTVKDIENRTKVVLIDKINSVKIFGKENGVGEKINISVGGLNDEYKVVGIIDNENSINEMIKSEMPVCTYVPISKLADTLRIKSVGEILISTKNEEELDNAAKSVIKFLEQDKKTTNFAYYENLNNQKNSIKKIADIVTLIITLIGGISLIVGGIGVMNIMLVAVSERTREIGIKKAIGISNFKIMAEFLIEAMIITGISCLMGVVVGLLLSYFVTTNFNLECSANFQIIRSAFIISMGMGVLFGVYPAIKAAKLNPIEALKYE